MKAALSVVALAAVIVMVAAVFLWSQPVRAASCTTVKASYYCCQHHGRLTASGQRFNQNAMTAAHKTLPFGTKLRVSYNGRTVTVRVNDRGPYIRGRSLDLSLGAARKLGMVNAGVATVRMCR